MKKKVAFWFDNARPVSLPQSMLPALTAVALSYGEGEFNWVAALTALVGVMFLHLSVNLLDDWFDYKVGSAEARKKAANEGLRGRMTKYPYLTSGQATHGQLLKAVVAFGMVAAVMGCIIISIRGWDILWWVAAAILFGESYSGAPLKLSFHGLGEMDVFIMFGPLLMTGVYYSITGTFDTKIACLSIAVGLLVTNIVYSHSVLDAVPDRKMGKKTMAHLMGSPRGQVAFSALLNTLPYLIVVAMVILGQLHVAYLSVLLVLPVSLWLVSSLNAFVHHRKVPIETKWWMGPMGAFERYRSVGLDWFMLRWLTARNIVTMFCMVLVIVNLIF